MLLLLIIDPSMTTRMVRTTGIATYSVDYDCNSCDDDDCYSEKAAFAISIVTAIFSPMTCPKINITSTAL